ncbi:hypothetical protein BDK51DRAFT_45144 [Blyttiomyces helicus]|uniref:Uncharacterized protein n=1 Tax=Blyttiomyces helicus TaxID=388810 RepID=A0A4P9VU46_9FUNG|nr:hypothetical protein BDK51DRAFT_45144 [Blyttiomyces helicus]|eukprot:RKO83084.1 hypothetical protein BDK51DRAFT_45144 [Blyttiomyces helicus]
MEDAGEAGVQFVHRHRSARDRATGPLPWDSAAEAIVIADELPAHEIGANGEEGMRGAQEEPERDGEQDDPLTVSTPRTRAAELQHRRATFERLCADADRRSAHHREQLHRALEQSATIERKATDRRVRAAARERREQERAELVAARDRCVHDAARVSDEAASASEICSALSSLCAHLRDERAAHATLLHGFRQTCDAEREKRLRIISDARRAMVEIDKQIAAIPRDEVELVGRVDAEKERLRLYQAMKVTAEKREQEVHTNWENAEKAIMQWTAEQSDVDQEVDAYSKGKAMEMDEVS